MARICLVVAHSAVTDRQARISEIGLDEYGASRRQTAMVQAMLHDAGHDTCLIDTPHRMYPGYLTEHVRLVNEAHRRADLDLAVEIHHNAGPAGTSGPYSMVLYYGEVGHAPQVRDLRHSEEGKKAASLVAWELERTCPWRSVGARPHEWTDRSLTFIEDTAPPAIIVEPGFFEVDDETPPAELAWYSAQGLDLEAEAIGRAICKFAGEV